MAEFHAAVERFKILNEEYNILYQSLKVRETDENMQY